MADEDDPYECVASGGLRLKGGKVKKSKKKKKKNKAKNILEEASKSSSKESKQDEEDGESDYEEAGSSSQKQEEEEIVIKKTAAELAFEKAQERRAAQRILEKASKTHKQRVEELNDYLGGLSEHYDIQKVSWTK